jgi:hypothetical protein
MSALQFYVKISVISPIQPEIMDSNVNVVECKIDEKWELRQESIIFQNRLSNAWANKVTAHGGKVSLQQRTEISRGSV